MVDTIAYLDKGITIKDIETAISKKYKKVEIFTFNSESLKNFYNINFIDGRFERILSVSFVEDADAEIKGIWCRLVFFGNAVKIMKYLCETFGGTLQKNDYVNEFIRIDKK